MAEWRKEPPSDTTIMIFAIQNSNSGRKVGYWLGCPSLYVQKQVYVGSLSPNVSQETKEKESHRKVVMVFDIA